MFSSRIARIALASLTGLVILFITGQAKAQAAPDLPTIYEYEITVEGVTSHGDTNVHSDQTNYQPAENFRLTGQLFISAPVRAAGGALRPGRSNVCDVALKVANPIGAPQPGAVRFASNTLLQTLYGASRAIANAALDVADVQLDQANDVIVVNIDPANARTTQMNMFNVRGGMLAEPYQISAGQMVFRVNNEGQISGTYTFVGGGYMHPGTNRIDARFTGRRVK